MMENPLERHDFLHPVNETEPKVNVLGNIATCFQGLPGNHFS
jgi:hypothetical protein